MCTGSWQQSTRNINYLKLKEREGKTSLRIKGRNLQTVVSAVLNQMSDILHLASQLQLPSISFFFFFLTWAEFYWRGLWWCESNNDLRFEYPKRFLTKSWLFMRSLQGICVISMLYLQPSCKLGHQISGVWQNRITSPANI